jgi:hypothetical protein
LIFLKVSGFLKGYYNEKTSKQLSLTEKIYNHKENGKNEFKVNE